MADFTDAEDRQLVQLALAFSRSRRQILWDRLTHEMKGTQKSKEALRQRLKTLKRTHGRNLENFPAWYFKTKNGAIKGNPRRLRRMDTNVKAAARDKIVGTQRSRDQWQECACNERKRAQEVAETSPNFTFSTKVEEVTALPSCSKPNPPVSLLLLAYVATHDL